MDTPNSQKKSPRSSAKSERSRRAAPDGASRPQSASLSDDDEQYMGRSGDLVARVRAAKEAAQREMESFGDPSEYDITIIHGQKKDEPPGASQPPLEFETIDTNEAD